MPNTAEQLVEALRVNFGVPRAARAVRLMEAWLNERCRDWRRHDDGEQVVVAMVLREPIKGQAIRVLLASHVRRWGFEWRKHARGNLDFLTVESYMMGPPGELMQEKVRQLLTGPDQGPARAKKDPERKARIQAPARAKKDPKRKARAYAFARRLTGVLHRKLKPTLAFAIRRFWNDANRTIYREMVNDGKNPH